MSLDVMAYMAAYEISLTPSMNKSIVLDHINEAKRQGRQVVIAVDDLSSGLPWQKSILELDWVVTIGHACFDQHPELFGPNTTLAPLNQWIITAWLMRNLSDISMVFGDEGFTMVHKTLPQEQFEQRCKQLVKRHVNQVNQID